MNIKKFNFSIEITVPEDHDKVVSEADVSLALRKQFPKFFYVVNLTSQNANSTRNS